MDMLKKMWPIMAICVILLVVNEFTGILEEKPSEEQIIISETEVNVEIKSNYDAMPTEEEATISSLADGILTVDNCEDLAKLLELKDPLDPSVSGFAENYNGCIIEFDGCVAYLNNHGDYKTRYDILIYGCDYTETSSSGPNFQFSDVGVHDLNISDLYLPDYISTGHNVHIVAEVGKYNPNSGLFQLEPISITER